MVVERHIGTVLGALILASVLWVGSNLTTNIETTARTDVRLGNIEEDIEELKSAGYRLSTEVRTQMNDRFTGTEAARVIETYDARFNNMEKWSRETETRLDKLERDHENIKPGVKR
jgi:hypothetical protein